METSSDKRRRPMITCLIYIHGSSEPDPELKKAFDRKKAFDLNIRKPDRHRHRLQDHHRHRRPYRNR